MGCQPTPLLVLLAAAGWATSSKRWWPLVLHSTCRRVRDFSSRADVHVCFDLNPCCIAAAQLRGQVSARHTKAASLCHGSRSAALLPDAFCHQSHHG
ncbi:hypothetical protein HDV62DRAFT_372266 [Trichoderma sp. SZMC 28011]